MDEEYKFTPPEDGEFPKEYEDGFGCKVTIYARGHGKEPLLGQYPDGKVVSYDLKGSYGIDDPDYDLSDIPKRITTWHNVYKYSRSYSYKSRKSADIDAGSYRVCVCRLECDEDGGNPEIFLEDL